jgi:type II secretory ATPase GspE/PulE/Tfp pilus assembly ATPase PilB-like protein
MSIIKIDSMADNEKKGSDSVSSSGAESARKQGAQSPVGDLRRPMSKQGSAPATIESIKDVPPIKTIFTNNEGDFSLPPNRREKCIAIGLVNGLTWIIVEPEFYREQGIVVSTIREKMRQAHVKVDSIKFADSPLIAQLYSVETRETNSSDEPETAESRTFDEIIRYGKKNRATDVHFEVRGQHALVRFRIDGDLEPMRNASKGIFPMEQIRDTIGFAYNKLQSQRTGSHANFSPETSQSCMIPHVLDGKTLNLRYQASRAWGGFDVVIRYLTSETVKTTNFDELGYSDDQSKMLDIAARSRSGMILIVGITGSGKSTTLKTVVANIPGKEGLKIFTVEDPVEDEIPGATQISVQRTMQADSDKMPLKELEGVLMRMDPDVIMQGEIRDKDSGSTAQVFLETGHQVMATLHANSALGTFPRLLSDAIQFSISTITSKEFWSLIIYQALVPRLCPECKIPAEDVMPKVLEFITYRFGIRTDDMCVKNPDGCQKCDHRGTVGQTVVAEMISPTRKFLSFIREGKEFEAEKDWREASDKKFDSPNMTGKTVFEHALYKAYIGMVDIRVVERFGTFERYENIWEL